MKPFSRLRHLYLMAVILAVLGGLTLAAVQTAAPTNTGENTTVRDTAAVATVGVWEGRLAVFPPHTNVPSTVYDVYISSLPTAEQEVLLNGITVYSEEALQRLLEDYTG